MGGVRRAPRRVKVYFDGGCRPNPGRIEVAVVARGKSYFFDDLGEGTSSDAEWRALGAALEVARSLEAAQFELIGDCANVIAQAKREAPCRSAAAAQYRETLQQAGGSQVKIRWVRRNQNLAGIALERRRSRL
ncbi:MAG TPA: reverse transcriptase-like protein [Allosphingosinicella sp.]